MRDTLLGCTILLTFALVLGAVIVVWVQLAREIVLWVS